MKNNSQQISNINKPKTGDCSPVISQIKKEGENNGL